MYMQATRLSALDASFLAAETPTAHMHVGWAAVFDPPEDGRRPSFRELRDHLASRLNRAPRYRQRLAFVPFDLHDPVWVDDDKFDIDRHVMEAQSGDIGTVAETAMSTPLERSRPMWETWIAPELDDGRIGVVGKVHHCTVDGLAAVELATLLLDATPEPPAADIQSWDPQPAPGMLERLVQGIADRAVTELALLRLPAAVLGSPGRIAADARRAAQAVANTFGRPATPTSTLNPEISPLRGLARIGRPIDDLIRIKSHFGTTLNDVVLAVCSGGVQRFLLERGEVPGALKAMVPVTMRGADAAGDLGNRISFMFMELPTDEPDPVARLREINGTTSERKRSGEPQGGDTVLTALQYTPRLVQRMMTRLVSSPHTFNLVVSNIPGPREPLWMRGCRLRESYPVVPLAERHAVSIGVTSIADGLFFGIYVDRKALPDADQLATHIDESIDELLTLCGGGPNGSGNGRGNGRAPRTVRRPEKERATV
jgi:diacylglycerol O-acyltransferase